MITTLKASYYNYYLMVRKEERGFSESGDYVIISKNY